jgi:hypothetical protein
MRQLAFDLKVFINVVGKGHKVLLCTITEKAMLQNHTGLGPE